MTRTPMPLFDTSLLGPFALWVNNQFGKVINEQVIMIGVLVSRLGMGSRTQHMHAGMQELGQYANSTSDMFHILQFSSPCFPLLSLFLSLSLSLSSTLRTYIPCLCHSLAQIFLLVDLYSHAHIGCKQICTYFNISCFTIPYPPPSLAPPEDATMSKKSNGSETLRKDEATATSRNKGDT